MKRIGVVIILLLLIGGTYAKYNISDIAAEDNTSIDNTSIVRKDFEHKLSNESKYTNTSTDYIGNVDVTAIEDTNRSNATETIPTEKKSSPGFGSIVTTIAFLSLVVVMTRRR